ncbi:MAG: DUF2842 domain-containing protein [Hyphomicrobiales bacterium]|nr:MAG: DUF2842 domain-containing protein [Hyphomicrobiales bacterium]
MQKKTRSLLATIGIIVVTLVYPVTVAIWLGEWLSTLPAWGSIPLFAVLGALWCLPMAVLIRWMARPD